MQIIKYHYNLLVDLHNNKIMKKFIYFKKIKAISLFVAIVSLTAFTDNQSLEQLAGGVVNPPEWSRPGVYWYFMDGNISKESLTADLESMKKAGIGHALFLEVNVGIPRGKVDFLSEEWQDLFVHMVRESERLGIAITLGVGPGWTGSGGPWVTGNTSMKHLVYNEVTVKGGEKKSIVIQKPRPITPFFGEGIFTPELREKWLDYYEDVALLAFPTPAGNFRIADVVEKAIYVRAPYTSMKGVKPFLPSSANYRQLTADELIQPDRIIDLTGMLKSDSILEWKVPEGNWTIMRFGSRNNGAVTRPAPMPGLGFEVDKMDTSALKVHIDNFIGKLLSKTGLPDKEKQGGLKFLHMDSYEMGGQNWTAQMREEFRKRRGYDPLHFYPVYAGLVVGDIEKSERFLWDLRQTFQELIIENHAQFMKNFSKKNNMNFSIEPYDMSPNADMELGSVADLPMCEFWSVQYGFNSAFSCIQAASIAHIDGKKVVAAEAFTAYLDAWKQYPGSMKNQGDWAFAAGVNKFMYHTYQHQTLHDSLKPGNTMGPYGVHHDRGQTWWPMVDEYHRYISRCQYMLQQGEPVGDILYLTPEGAPQVFRAPKSALTQEKQLMNSLSFTADDVTIPGISYDNFLPDRKGYNFSGVAPSQLMRAVVKKGKVVFPSGASFHILVLPKVETMTPELLSKIEELVRSGASVMGNPPSKSPSLVNYPDCDEEVQKISENLWNSRETNADFIKIQHGKGEVYSGQSLYANLGAFDLYPDYSSTAAILHSKNIPEDFISSEPVRYIHKVINSNSVYFVSNKTDQNIHPDCIFRVDEGSPELWDPMTGEIRPLTDFLRFENQTQISLKFEPYESYFIVFNKSKKATKGVKTNFPTSTLIKEISGPWKVNFDPKWGGPATTVFDSLIDWTSSTNNGIKYYSGIAVYKKSFIISEISRNPSLKYFIELGEVNNLARVKLNGKDLGVAWAAPFKLDITSALKAGENSLEIEVVNLWPNRLIGDEFKPYDGIVNGEWPKWLLEGKPRTSGRYTFTTWNHFTRDSKLLKSGLMGPVRITIQK